MSASALTFDQLESSADNTLAWVLWAKHAKNLLWCAAALAIVNKLLGGLVDSMTADKLSSLSHEQAAELKKSLQEIHAHLVYLLRHRNCDALRANPLFRSSISGLAEHSDDLGDIIEDLVLAENPQFATLVADCVQALSHSHAVGSVGGM